MKCIRYISILLLVIAVVALIFLTMGSWHERWNYLLIFSAFIALLRLIIGPATIDRVAAMKVISVIIINFSIIMGVMTNNDLYVDIAIAWAFQAFIGTLIFAKHGEGKNLDA
ncbi:MAG: monovalent cation/H+ antiporter complex subunit F [Elusimicrobia bacterium]|nr:monovalent cation/H+ antiporter complex subunit F [Elusimicrobiota bacterium]